MGKTGFRQRGERFLAIPGLFGYVAFTEFFVPRIPTPVMPPWYLLRYPGNTVGVQTHG